MKNPITVAPIIDPGVDPFNHRSACSDIVIVTYTAISSTISSVIIVPDVVAVVIPVVVSDPVTVVTGTPSFVIVVSYAMSSLCVLVRDVVTDVCVIVVDRHEVTVVVRVSVNAKFTKSSSNKL